jgi:hypothetical protein
VTEAQRPGLRRRKRVLRIFEVGASLGVVLVVRTASSVRRRLEAKRLRSQLKAKRRDPPDDER